MLFISTLIKEDETFVKVVQSWRTIQILYMKYNDQSLCASTQALA